jgi:hypothetical protein
MNNPLNGPLPVVAREPRVAVMAGAMLLAGCYSYSSPKSVAPEPGSHVSIRLSSDASRDLTPELGPAVSYVEGTVLANDSAGLHLSVSRVQGLGQMNATWTGEPVTFSHSSYLSLEVRHLNLPGTILAGGLAIGAAVALRQAFDNGSNLNTQPGVITNPAQ